MVPILHMGHWTLYVINIQLRCIHILDSNPYGPELGGTSWKMFHYSQKDIGTRKLPWARVIMNRLNKSLQQVRPNSRIPKFGNFPIDMPPMCPTMIAGSNDCGFFCHEIHPVLWPYGWFYQAIYKTSESFYDYAVCIYTFNISDTTYSPRDNLYYAGKLWWPTISGSTLPHLP